ncbi:MAG TPA: FAD-binding oxidoreductase [Clostridiaceae bacterium]|nr:FAD-binding oxidoreductase [Clostridiaceae bacterium]
MEMHEDKVLRISSQLKGRRSTEPLTRKKKTVSHEVPKPNDRKHTDEKLDISDLDGIIHIDPESRTCIAEPGATFEEVVDAAMRHGLVPAVVPELRTITIGGAVAGCSIESMSYVYGGFHDTCLEYEVVTARGDVLICTPENENRLVFQMMHGTFGTLGIITRLKFMLIPAKPFVKVVYEEYGSLREYMDAIWNHYTRRDVDFMDGIIHSKDKYILSAGHFVDTAPYTHNYDWMRVYYRSTAERKEDYLKTPDYFFRYNKGVTNVLPKSFIGRFLFGRFTTSNNILRMAHATKKVIPQTMIPITLDTFIPFSKMEEFMAWYGEEVDHFPLWCVPYRIVRKYEWLAEGFSEKIEDELFLDIAIYGMHRKDTEHYYRILEKKLYELGAIKTLISTNLYSEEEFWKIWNRDNYELVKQQTDPDNIFRGLHEKTCQASRGLGR